MQKMRFVYVAYGPEKEDNYSILTSAQYNIRIKKL